MLPRPQMYDVADSILAQKLSQIEGVGQVEVWGSSQPAVRVQVNPHAAEQLWASVSTEVATALCRLPTRNQAKGAVSATDKCSWQIDAQRPAFQGRAIRAADRGCTSNGAPVRLARLWPRASIRSKTSATPGSVNGKPAVLIMLFRQPERQHH